MYLNFVFFEVFFEVFAIDSLCWVLDEGFGVKGFVFTGEQVAYCVGDSSQAQNDNGGMR
jgi:hypothetical protein